MRRVLVRNWFLIALVGVLSVGIGFSASLAGLPQVPGLRQSIVAIVMFVMALPLRAEAFGHAIRRPAAPLLGSVINYGLVPLLAWGVCLVIGIALGVSASMRDGILVASTAPCTLASASVWTRRAGGNDVVATMVTIITNLLCFLLTPAWIRWMVGRAPTSDAGSMVVSLALLVVLPIVAAQVVRLAASVGRWATAQKIPLGVLAQTGILTMVFLGAIQTGLKLSASGLSAVWNDLLVMLVAVVGIHLAALYLGLATSRVVGFPREDSIAIGFSGSQKTLMVGLEACAQLGITILPMVAYHVGQLLADTVVAQRLCLRDRERSNGLPRESVRASAGSATARET